jgi:hypothetical protein
MSVLIVIKVLVFLYIAASPFIDHNKYLKDLNNMPFKLLFVALIVAAAFVDFQLAILLTIALFIMVIMFTVQKKPQVTMPTPMPMPMPMPSSLTPATEPFIESQQEVMVQPYENDIMHNFPDATCNTKPFEDIQLSNNMFSYYIDPKVKPYEVYLRMITNEDNLHKAQSNSF